MKMLFNKIKDQDFEMVKNIQSKTQYNGSEWSKLYLKVWDFFNYETAEFAIENDIAFIRFKTQQKFKKWIKEDTLYLPPMCDISNVKDAINMAREQAKADTDDPRVLQPPARVSRAVQRGGSGDPAGRPSAPRAAS